MDIFAFCRFNPYSQELEEFFERYNIEHVVEECMGNCDTCREKAYVVYGDTMMVEDTGKELIEKIKSMLGIS